MLKPNWDKVETLHSWASKQPADKEYHYSCGTECLLAQYLEAHGFDGVTVGDRYFDHDRSPESYCDQLPQHFDRIAEAEPHTFGAAAERARELTEHLG